MMSHTNHTNQDDDLVESTIEILSHSSSTITHTEESVKKGFFGMTSSKYPEKIDEDRIPLTLNDGFNYINILHILFISIM